MYRIHHTHKTRGQVMMLMVILFLAGSLMVLGSITFPVRTDARLAHELLQSKKSYFLAEGLIEDVVYRLQNGDETSPSEILSEGGTIATATITDMIDGFDILVSGDTDSLIRNVTVSLVEGEGIAFNYGVQADTGGVIMENSSSVLGNVYANGPVNGSNSNIVKGDIISADSGGLVSGSHATGSVYAHTIQNSTIDKDAYFQTISGSTVSGISYPGSADQPTTTLAIPDSKVAAWEAEAIAGGTILAPCPYKITGATTIGPKRILCDLEISGTGYTVTLLGPLWVAGNITITNSPNIRLDASLGKKSIPIIADKLLNRLTSSKINIANSTTFEGSGTEGSYVLLLSMNKSAELGGGERAIEIQNSASGDLLLYAGHGEILLQNSISLKEVSGYRIRLKNSAEVVYETGLANTLFSAGPSGGFSIDLWQEVE